MHVVRELLHFALLQHALEKLLHFALTFLLHFASMLLHFALVLHFAAILITFCVNITSCGDHYILRRNTPRISSKILRCASYFQLSSQCLDIPMKHRLSCLTYYIKTRENSVVRITKFEPLQESIKILLSSVADQFSHKSVFLYIAFAIL